MQLGFGLCVTILLCSLPLCGELVIYVSCVGVGFGLGLPIFLCSLPWTNDLMMLRAARVWLGPFIYFFNLPWASDLLLLHAARFRLGPCISFLQLTFVFVGQRFHGGCVNTFGSHQLSIYKCVFVSISCWLGLYE